MTKVTNMHLARVLSEKEDISLCVAQRLVDAIFDELSQRMVCKQPITITNFGSFNLRTTKPRAVNNLRGEGVSYTSSRDKPMFKPSRKLLHRINT
jgi:nucleoid DNA-binding protein